MQYLPDPDEQKWLIRYLRKLIERAGYEHFVRAPILEPLRTWFPEGWSGTVRDAHIVTQRLLHYAGIGELRPVLEGFEALSDDSEDFDTAAYFAGIRDGQALFGIKEDILDDPEKAAGTMAHEVAHAWRARQRITLEEARDREELLTDVTTVYLGFGIFTTNNTDRFRSEGDVHEQRWSFSRVGYLPMQAMAFLLALQASARDDRDEIASIEKHLEANQQRAFREAMELFEEQDVLELLALPPRATWPERERTPRSIRVYEPGKDVVEIEDDADDPQRNSGFHVWRRPVDSRDSTLILSILGALALALVFTIGDELSRNAKLGAVAAIVIVGVLVSRARRRFVCSDESCRTTVTDDQAVCRGCGGLLARTAEDALERNAAGDDYVDCAECEPEAPCARHA